MEKKSLSAQLPAIAIEEHNREAQAVWDAFYTGEPVRPPVVLGTATLYFTHNQYFNPGEAVTFECSSRDACAMFDFQLRSATWRARHIAPIVMIPSVRRTMKSAATNLRPVFLLICGQMRLQLEPEVTIHGGPNISLLRNGTSDEVRIETQRILESRFLKGDRFVLQEGNNLASHTPFDNLAAMYQTVRSSSWIV
jgi:hypothetical protein